MRHESTALGTEVNQLVTQQVRLQTTDTVAGNTLYVIQCLHEIQECLPCRLSEITDIHSRQHDLLATLTDCLFRLPSPESDGGITTEAAGIGYRTIGTEIVTSVLHLQEITGTVATGARGCEGFDILRLLRLVGRYLVAVHETIGEELDEMSLLISAQHQVDTFYLTDRFGLQLRITSCHYHKGMRMLACHTVDGLSALMVSDLRHRTGIDQTDIRSSPLAAVNTPIS